MRKVASYVRWLDVDVLDSGIVDRLDSQATPSST